MPIFLRLAALAFTSCLSLTAVANSTVPASYGFPISNPFEATIAGTPAELRLFILDGQDNRPKGRHAPFDASQGRNVRIDLPQLIQQVYVSPFADPGYAELVSQRLYEAGLNPLLLRQSEIRDR